MNEIVTTKGFDRASWLDIMDLIEEVQKHYPRVEIDIKAYGRSMSPYPLWALRRAVTDLMEGKIDDVNASFCPDGPKIGQIANGLVEAERRDWGERIRSKQQRAETKRIMNLPAKTDAQKARVAKLVKNFHNDMASELKRSK